MEQLSLPLPAGPAASAAHDAASDSPLPAYLLARLDEECRKPNPTDTRVRRLIISGCVPAYYAPASKEPQRITDALRERNFTLLDGARALRINREQVDALERIQHTLSSRELLVIVSALDQYLAAHNDDSRLHCAYNAPPDRKCWRNAYHKRPHIESQFVRMHAVCATSATATQAATIKAKSARGTRNG
jgi:hypothetical protein